jgi:spermidine synthase
MEQKHQPIDRQVEEGMTYELQQREDAYDVLVDGRRILSTDDPRNANSLAELALAPFEGHDDIRVLLGGLGAGHTLRQLLARPGVAHVDVVEISRSIIHWELEYFGGTSRDPRVSVHACDLAAYLRQPRDRSWHALVLDVDEWPISLFRPENVELYHDEGMLLLEGALCPGGSLLIWSARRDDELFSRMHRRLEHVARVALPVDGGLDYAYRGRRPIIVVGAA